MKCNCLCHSFPMEHIVPCCSSDEEAEDEIIGFLDEAVEKCMQNIRNYSDAIKYANIKVDEVLEKLKK